MNTLFCNKQLIVLASNSPRRRTFLEQIGLAFTVSSDEVDESILRDEKPEAYVVRLAVEKGLDVARKNNTSWVISADTIVVNDGHILGKPVNEAEAVNILLSLSGKDHQVYTAFCVRNEERNIIEEHLVKTCVSFVTISREMALAYARTGEPLDKAGAYGIQGLGGSFVKKINGSYSNVVGLPMTELLDVLSRHGVIVTV